MCTGLPMSMLSVGVGGACSCSSSAFDHMGIASNDKFDTESAARDWPVFPLEKSLSVLKCRVMYHQI